MTLTQFGVALATFAALGAAIAAGPPIWGFIRNVARLPYMTESIWREFGRSGDGTSTTRDLLQHIARKVEVAEVMAQQGLTMSERNVETVAAHTQSDAAAFLLIAQTSQQIVNRLSSLEREVIYSRKQEGDHADAAKADRNGSM